MKRHWSYKQGRHIMDNGEPYVEPPRAPVVVLTDIGRVMLKERFESERHVPPCPCPVCRAMAGEPNAIEWWEETRPRAFLGVMPKKPSTASEVGSWLVRLLTLGLHE